ncbi:hypothetical protein ACXO6H_04110, partial [Lactobacillus delbrueckii subsp. bulgaricus]
VVGELEVVLVSLWKLVFSAFYLVHLGFHSVQISFQSRTFAGLLLALALPKLLPIRDASRSAESRTS